MTAGEEGDVLPALHQGQVPFEGCKVCFGRVRASLAPSGSHPGVSPPPGRLTALCLNAESVFEALVGVGAGDHFWVRAPHVHVFGANDDVAAITLESGH